MCDWYNHYVEPLFTFFNVLLVAVIFSQFFLHMKIPWVVALLVGGIVIGPSGFDLFTPDPTIEFFSYIGLIFLMFMAGIESRVSNVSGIQKRIAITGFFIGFIPMLAGFFIVLALGYELQTAVLMGIVFISSAVAVVIPQFQEHKLLNSDLGKTVIVSAVVVDVISLFLLAFFLQYADGSFTIMSLASFVLTILLLALLAFVIPKIRMFTFEEDYPEKQDLYEKELRFLILVLVGFVIMFELLGLHAIVAAFFAGLVLSGSMKSRLLKAKLHAMSYGFLIPIFFVTIGAKVDLSVLMSGFDSLLVFICVIGGLIITKFVGGWIAGRLVKFNNLESIFIGAAVLPQLSTTLAVTFLGFDKGLLDEVLVASVVALSIIATIIAPILIGILGPRLHSQQVMLSQQDVTDNSTSHEGVTKV